jgi:Cd2+/Zn2+-exporting ATPase
MPTQIYTLRGMDCADCALKIEKGVRLLEGVHNARVDFATAKLKIEGDISTAAIRQRVEALGYQLDEPTAQPARRAGGLIGFGQYLWERSETRPALAGGAIILLTLLASRLGLPPAAARGLWIGALAAAGYPIARSGLSALLINRDFNINLLMTLAAIGAVVIGEPLEAATLIFLFALAEALEGYTTDRARDSLRGLMELAPARAVRLGRDKDAGREETVPVEALQVGDTILIRPGERIPMDGVITVGASEVNQAPITGESLPVQKVIGDEVFAGTVNGSGALEARVTHLAQDNTLSRIIRLVEEAQSVRAPAQRRIDQFARVYTPATVGAAVLVAALPPLLFGQPFWDTPVERGWLYRALALLVIACPCALVISAPVTVISALTSAARRGVLIKGGAHLETLAQVKAFAFDKTGTLTLGEPVVTQARAVDCAAGGECEQCDDVLALASALERRSAHPLARSVVAAAEQRGVAGAYAAAENVEALAGRGLQGWVNGKRVTLGHHRLFDDEHPHDEAFCQLMDEAEARGQTVMAVCDGDRVRGFIALADAVRPDSAAALSALHALDCRTIMLTGDNATAAREAARQVGVRDVRAGLLPEDKSDAVRALRDEFGCVAMVGDGINDTPALAAANVGVAVGGAASAQAIEAADVVLMADGLRRLPFAVRLSRFARRLIAQNISLSLITKAVFMLLALAGLTSLWLAILGDMGVSLLVTVNGMRPLRFEREA